MEQFLVTHWQPPGGQGQNVVSGFKDSQKSAMEAICARASDVLVPLPTGEGKSVLFQVPALCRGLRNRRLTLVISPLKALMEDQVERLREQGFAESVDYLSGDLTPYAREGVMQGVLDHRIVLLYLAPERLRSPAFLDVLGRRIESDGGLEHVVVDEAHCVNQWGYEFRPDYFHATDYLLRTLRDDNEVEPSPFLLLSATVTASDQERLTAVLAAHPSKQLTNRLLVRPDAFTNPLRAHIAVTPQRVHGQINDKQGFPQAVEERLKAISDAMVAARSNKQATGQRSAVIVFVAWRTQAEDLAALLAARFGEGVDYYHAGLDAATRVEIYTRFRERDLDVLVATKAFGMGMDIPDIHWVVHLGPPSYLEDYLQEVGRIGRGAAERERASLGRLSAVLLFSNADFESNRVMRAQSALQLPQIRESHQKIAEHADELAGQRIAFVPQHGYETYKTEGEKRANATRMRMSLYWLERAGAVQLHGVVADLLAIDIEWARLRRTAEEESLLGVVASTILQLDDQKEPVALSADTGQRSTGTASDWLSRAIDGLKSVAGFFFGASPMPASGDSRGHASPASLPEPERRAAIINLSQIRVRCKIKTMSEVMACLADLEKRGDVSLRWTLGFVGRTLAGEPSARIQSLFDAVGSAVDSLIDRLSRRERVEFNPDELLDDARIIEGVDGMSPEEVGKLRKRYRRAWLHGFRSQARASGLRVRQLVRKDEHLVWEAMLPSTKRNAARQRNVYLLKSAQSLFKLFKRNQDAGMSAVSVPELIRAMQAENPNGRFHRKDLKPLLNLLAAMSLVSASPETLPLSHVIVLPDDAPPLDSQTALWQELKRVNDLAEVRVQAMEVFANLPDEARDNFIEGYFAQKDAEGLRGFLDAQLGEIDDTADEDISGFILAKREQLRATKVVEFFKFYEGSEEPNQWKAIQHPFDRHLLVNAGPGAGKTAVLVGRIVHLIREQQIKPAEIVVLAFNRAVVFEIRKRIHELFTSLGYGSYVRRVRVSTFHSLAMRSLARTDEHVDGGRMENLLADFAEKLSSDARFREQVAGGCRCILVDEFQDVTEDVYAIVRNLYLGSGSRAGVMVIGDDDQDVLRWKRPKTGGKSEFAEFFFTRFRSEFSGEEPVAYLELGVNFRSGKDIVELSQKMISTSLERNSQSSRLKQGQLRPRHMLDDCSG
ncbi:MAG: UvrD-helicase domain-containing protein, partial [Rhodanobacteraceae bacterium]